MRNSLNMCGQDKCFGEMGSRCVVLVLATASYNELQERTVDSLLTDTSVKRTLRVGPCLSLLPLFDSL